MIATLAELYVPLTQAETEQAHDLLYFLSPVEGEARTVEQWTLDELRVFERWAVRVGIWVIAR